MRKAVFATLGALLVGVAAGQTNAPQSYEGAHLAFVKAHHNFGAVSRSAGVVQHDFVFRNDGTRPLVVLDVATSCPCMRINYSRRPVAAGAYDTIRIFFDVRKVDRGVFNRVAHVQSNSVDGTKRLTVQGTAE